MLDALGRLGRTDIPFYRSDLRERCKRERERSIGGADPPSNEQINALCDVYEHMVVQIAVSRHCTATAYGPPPTAKQRKQWRQQRAREGYHVTETERQARYGYCRWVKIETIWSSIHAGVRYEGAPNTIEVTATYDDSESAPEPPSGFKLTHVSPLEIGGEAATWVRPWT